MAIANSLMSSQLAALEFDLAKLSTLVEFIIKSVDELVTTFEQFIKNNLVFSSMFGNKINKLMVYLGVFSKFVGKLEREVIILKIEYGIENANLSGNSNVPVGVSNKIFGKLIAL
ncbi:hypothetical protein G9A89_006145 [Geosiphon pyriformis]|nr:hypothetical protein G9A89_006145 [Geosiphon pyriformis]